MKYMGKIVCLMGKSAVGKDSVYKRLLEDRALGLKTIVPYTTRPIRDGEQEGVEYFFTDESGYEKYRRQGKIIEERLYHTMLGPWRYFTVDDGRIEAGSNYLVIGTLESYLKLRDYFGVGRVIPVLLEVDDGIRLQRALDREREQEQPKYEELCRRFLADSEDFASEKIIRAGVHRSFINVHLEKCLKEIYDYIRGQIDGD